MDTDDDDLLNAVYDVDEPDEEPRFGVVQATAEEILHALFGEPDKPKAPASAKRAEKKAKKEKPKMELTGTYATPEDVDKALAENDAAVDELVERGNVSGDDLERLFAERDALYERKWALEGDLQSAQSALRGAQYETQEELGRRRKAADALAAVWQDPSLPEAQRSTALADFTIEQGEIQDLQTALPWVRLDDPQLSAGAEDARVELETLTEQANALPQGSVRRKRAEAQAAEAHTRAIAMEAESRRRRDRAALDAFAAKRTEEYVQRKIKANREAVIRDAVQTKEPEWYIDKLKEEAKAAPSKKELAEAKAQVEAELAPRIREYARYAAERRAHTSR